MTNTELASYLRETVIERTLSTDDVIYFLDEGKLKGVYSDTMLFSDLMTTENGVKFNMTTVTTEKIWVLNDKGEEKELKKDFCGTSVFRYELALRKSTGEITGFMRCLSSTVRQHTMEGVVYGIYGVKLQNGSLKWKEKQMFYRDTPSEDKCFKPVAFDAEVSFSEENGKLMFEYLPRYFDVDPVSMERTLSLDSYPPFISKEK